MARKRLKIAIVCYPTFGGSGIVATELGKALAARGHIIHFLSYNIPARLTNLPPTVHFHPVEVVTYPLFRFPPYTLALATRLAQVITDHKIDLVHAHYAIPHSISAQLAKDMTGNKDLKIVTTLHGTDVQLIGLDPSYKEITRFSMEGCCGLTAVSRHLARDTRKKFGLKKKIEVIPNFIDLELFRRRPAGRLRKRLAPEGEKIVVHLSNFRPVKQVLHVIKAFRRIQSRTPSVLVMIGDGPDHRAAEQQADSYGLSKKVHFLSFVGNVESYLAVSDLLLFPSKLESFGLAALEAMACEVPVLAYRVGGLPEVLGREEGGYLVEPGNWMAMAREGVRILSDEDLGRELGARGRKRAERLFSSDRVVGMYEDYYYRSLEND